jgi:uncharacterized protein YegL
LKDYADITILLDRSGSMVSIKDAMESGFDEFLNEHKKVPSTRLTLIQFDSSNNQEVVYTARPVAEAPRLSIDPRGMTPLLDAFCLAIDRTGDRLSAMRQEERPNKVLFVVITDGQENASFKYGRNDVKERVTRQQGSYNWQFVYLGANQDAIAEAATFGIGAANAMTYTADVMRSRSAMKSVAVNTLCYASTGIASTLDFADSQRLDASTEDPAEVLKKLDPGRLPT